MEIEERRVKISGINGSETMVQSGPKGDQRILISEYLME